MGVKRDLIVISSGSKGIGSEELWTRDWRRRTKREWAWVRATNFDDNASSSVVGYREVKVRKACIGYRWSGTLWDITKIKIDE